MISKNTYTKSPIRRIGVLTSGGDSPGMNAAIRAVARTCSYFDVDCLGFLYGYDGLINNQHKILGPRKVKHIIGRGGTALKSARSEAFRTVEGRRLAFENIKKNEVDALIVIGGDGSFTGAHIFSEEFDFPVIGIPGTIDNDIYGTDATIGYDTALNTAMDAIDKIRDTATSHSRVFFVEVMGRNAGFIALNSGISTGASGILIPEKTFDLEVFLNHLEKTQTTGKTSSIIVVTEDPKTPTKIYDLAKATEEKFPDYEVRFSILGHIQRGGSPSCFDRVLASKLGYAAVRGLLEGKTAVMAGICNNKITYTPLELAISRHHSIDEDLVEMSKILAI